MPPKLDSLYFRALLASLRLGLLSAAAMLLMIFMKTPRHLWHAALLHTFGVCVTFGVAIAILFFLMLLPDLRRLRRLDNDLEGEDVEPALMDTPMTGFIGMEFYRLIFNRTFVVFIGREGVYGWHAVGSVSGENQLYYRPFEEFLNNSEAMRDLEEIQRLSREPGGFFIPRSSIREVKATQKLTRWMQAVPHTGRVRLELTDGTFRELVVLGSETPEAVRHKILQISPIQGTRQDAEVLLPFVARTSRTLAFTTSVGLIAINVSLFAFALSSKSEVPGIGKALLVVMLLLSVLGVAGCIIPKLVFTSQRIERTNCLGQRRVYRYDELESYGDSPDRRGIRMTFSHGRHIYTVYDGQTLLTIMTLLQTKSPGISSSVR